MYFENIYSNPFTNDQKTIIKTLRSGIESFGWLAIAAERGGGKSTIARGVATWGINYGFIKFVVLFNANKNNANDSIENIKSMYENSCLLAEDFPEICYPVNCLEGAPQRAKMQISNGERTHIEWSRDLIIMPDIVGSPSAKSIIVTRGIDGAVRGLNKRNVRPDFVILDDVETRESAYSETETERRKATIEQDVVGLAGPGKKISAVMLGTIIKKDCIIDEFTDQKRKPAWHGVRQKLLIQKPTREDLWDKYIELRRVGQIEGDKLGKDAHKFYRKNRKDMDAGAKISNRHRYNKEFELSTLESCYILIADMEWASFACEYQNEPPDNMESGSSNIDLTIVCKKLNHLPKGVIPDWCDKLTCGIDVGGRLLHWSIVAWKQGLEGYVIDYGTEPVNSPYVGALTSDENKQSVETAILTALNEFWVWERETGWAMASSEKTKHIDLGLVDSGWMPDPVCLFCKQTRGKFRPTKGFGSGPKQSKFRQPTSKGNKKIGNHWHASRLPKYGWLFNLDSDYFKNFVHSGFMTPDNLPGSISLFGDEPVRHRVFAQQIVAEKWIREFQPGKGWREGFRMDYRQNHWLDTMASNIAAANMLNIRLMTKTQMEKPAKTVPKRKIW